MLSIAFKGFANRPGRSTRLRLQSAGSGVVLWRSVVFFLLLLPAVVYTILMSLRYSLAIPACVVEKLKARTGDPPQH